MITPVTADLAKSSSRPSADRGRPVRLAAYVVAGAAMLLICHLTRTKMLTDYDSWEYAYLAVKAQPSGLCLRRWWFIFFMRLSWLAGRGLGLDLTRCYVPMQAAVSLMSAGAVVAAMHWTYLVTRSGRLAVIAGVIALVSPVMAMLCSTVMTEGPALLFIMLAFIAWRTAVDNSRRRRVAPALGALLAGASFGIATIMREPALLLCAWPVVSCFVDRPRRRWMLLSLAAAGTIATMAIGVGMAWAWSGIDPVTVMGWYAQYMRNERASVPFWATVNVGALVAHFLLATPLAAAAFVGGGAACLLTPRRAGGEALKPGDAGTRAGNRRLRWLAASCIPFVAASWYNPNLSMNLRLMLPLAWVLLPVSAACADAGIRWILSGDRLSKAGKLALAAAAGWAFACSVYFEYAAVMGGHFAVARCRSNIYESMTRLPANAAVLVGLGRPVGIYLKNSGIRPDLEAIGTELTETTETLTRRIEQHMRAGRRVYVNLDQMSWGRGMGLDPAWPAVCRVARRYETRPGPGPLVELTSRSNGRPPATAPAGVTD